MSLETMTRQAEMDGQVSIEAGWGQGRATFGGLIGALLVARMRGALPADDIPLRTVTMFLMAPVVPGPVEVSARVLRRGSSVSVLEALLRQDGVVAASAQAAFGAERASSIELSADARIERPIFPAPESLQAIDFIPGVTPEFYRQVSVLPAGGGLPFSGANAPDFGGWMRFRDPITQPAIEHVVALIDAWPPAITPLLAGPKPVSTLSWTIDVISDQIEDSFAPERFWQYDVRTDGCSAGYAHSEAKAWAADGRLTAISRQTVSVFA